MGGQNIILTHLHTTQCHTDGDVIQRCTVHNSTSFWDAFQKGERDNEGLVRELLSGEAKNHEEQDNKR